ncbi:Ldh family oxidoreductase [Pararhizobium sp. IMCC21322]|uniref:Ldh family oxidoreductase n=1 Tax=Pararhizobium sp. IMCC21322 TaxID=3067903 RepID=UPI0027424D2E|nr:Ldh family oxidoreductase [Pararhizobium sp. IMCC21322]
MNNSARYVPESLRTMAKELFVEGGLETKKASAVAHYLVLADEMGRSTHGLALTAWYLQMLTTGDMANSGQIEIISDRAAAIAWNGGRLPGAWLTSKAVALASERAIQHGTCTIAIAECHHIGCLAAYLPDATDQGLMVSVASSSPSGTQVAPFGGTKGVFTPNLKTVC